MPDALHFTGNEEADRLIAEEPLALLIGFVLDQQVTVPTAFAGPLKLKQRLGRLDAAEIAGLDPDRLLAVFREKPGIHRFPGNMAKRVQEMCALVAEEYDGDASRVWRDATDTEDLKRRIEELPGFGEMKVRTVLTLLARQFGVQPPGIDALLPDHPTLGDVRTAEELASYQAGKRAAKAARRAAAK